MNRIPFDNPTTYLLTPWCRVLLQKLTGLQLVKKFTAFYGTRRFITALTSVRHLSLSCASPIQSTYPHPTPWRSILILSAHLRLGLPSGLFPSGFPTKTLYAPLSSPIRATCPNHLILLDFITRTILDEEYRSFSSPPLPHYLVPPRSKYSPKHHIFKHPQLPFLPQCQRPLSLINLHRTRKSCKYKFWGYCNDYFVVETALLTQLNIKENKTLIVLKGTFHDVIKLLPNFSERHSRGGRKFCVSMVGLKNLSLDFEAWEGTAI